MKNYCVIRTSGRIEVELINFVLEQLADKPKEELVLPTPVAATDANKWAGEDEEEEVKVSSDWDLRVGCGCRRESENVSPVVLQYELKSGGRRSIPKIPTQLRFITIVAGCEVNFEKLLDCNPSNPVVCLLIRRSTGQLGR